MALITCRECGKEVSGQALFSPHCGTMVPNQKGKKTIDAAIITYFVIFGIIVILALLLLASIK